MPLRLLFAWYGAIHLKKKKKKKILSAYSARTNVAISPEFTSNAISEVCLMSSLDFLSNYLSIISSEFLIERPKTTFLQDIIATDRIGVF